MGPRHVVAAARPLVPRPWVDRCDACEPGLLPARLPVVERVRRPPSRRPVQARTTAEPADGCSRKIVECLCPRALVPQAGEQLEDRPGAVPGLLDRDDGQQSQPSVGTPPGQYVARDQVGVGAPFPTYLLTLWLRPDQPGASRVRAALRARSSDAGPSSHGASAVPSSISDSALALTSS